MCFLVENTQINKQEKHNDYGKYNKQYGLSLIVVSEQGEDEHFAVFRV